MKINKIFMIMCLSVAMIFSVNALSLQVSQDNNIYDYTLTETGNHILDDIVGSVNNSVEIGNNTYYYDYEIEFSAINEDFYLIIENYFENCTINLLYNGDLQRDGAAYSQELTLNELGRYYLKFSPTYTDEPGRVYIDIETETHIIALEYIEGKPRGFNSLIGTFVSGFERIVDININFWTILWYTIIFIILVSFTLSLFALAFYLFKKAKHLREKGMSGG